MNIKRLKVPQEYDPVVLEMLFNDLFSLFQTRYFDFVSEKPADSDGKDGEIRLDASNGKIYARMNGSWESWTKD